MMGKNLLNTLTYGLAMKACPLNVKQLNYPLTKKKFKMIHPAQGSHITMNLAFAPGPLCLK